MRLVVLLWSIPGAATNGSIDRVYANIDPGIRLDLGVRLKTPRMGGDRCSARALASGASETLSA